jgi:hypothetical protein
MRAYARALTEDGFPHTDNPYLEAGKTEKLQSDV